MSKITRRSTAKVYPITSTGRTHWNWRLTSSNGHVIASGYGYNTKTNAKRAFKRLVQILGTGTWRWEK